MACATIKNILAEIGCPHLRLLRDRRSSYFYFVYDTPRVFETKSVFVPNLTSLPLHRWVADGRELVEACKRKEARV